jgi:ElaA protein
VERIVQALTLRSAPFADLTPGVLYAILRLRSEVFVVEQECVFLDADGRDTAPTAVHFWIEADEQVVACARLLREGAGSVLGRVVTAASHRRLGVAERLVRAALDGASRPVVIDAQSQLVAWYERLGFAVSGEEFVEDGIPHIPMVLA